MRRHMEAHCHNRKFVPSDSRANFHSSCAALCLVLLALLLTAPAVCYGQAASISAVAGNEASAPVGTTLAGHIFHQRGNGTANVAANYDFVNNTYQNAPNLGVHGKSFSVAFWYRSTQADNIRYGIIWDNGDGPGMGYVVGMDQGYISVAELNGSAGCPLWSDASVKTNDNQWHHAAVVADHDGQTTTIYRDGSKDTDAIGYCDPADNTSYSGNHWYGIGRNSPDYDFGGDIDHFTTWVGAALTPAEVNAHMNGGMPQFDKVGVWYEFENIGQCPVGNNNAQCVPDLGPNHYDGHVSPDTTPLVGPGPALQALVLDTSNNPVPNVEVTFQAPASGASGSFTGEINHQVKGTTDAFGVATAPTFTANGIPGYYKVQASVIGVHTPAKFSLANGPTFTTLGASPNPSYVGQPVTFTATVTSPGATPAGGTVTFRQGSTVLNTVLLDGGGIASFSTSALALGNNNVFAKYSGSSNFAPSTSTSVSEVVQPLPTTTKVTSSLSPSSFGQMVTFTVFVLVNPPFVGTPTGKVMVFYDGKKFGQAYLDNAGQATFSISSLPLGSHSITAQYVGFGNYAASSSVVLVQQVK